MLTLSPGWYWLSTERSCDGAVMRWPPSEVITSPAVRPARAAAEPCSTPAVSAPVPAGSPGAPPGEVVTGEAISMPRNAVEPVWTVAEELPASDLAGDGGCPVDRDRVGLGRGG